MNRNRCRDRYRQRKTRTETVEGRAREGREGRKENWELGANKIEEKKEYRE